MTSRQRKSRHGLAAMLGSGVVVLVALGFYGYAATAGMRSSGSTYPLQATFLSSNGLQPGADVLLAGVPVGHVTSIMLDTNSMTSHVNFVVQQGLALPSDTKLSIGSSTLTSSDSLVIAPGSSSRMLLAGSILTDTCEATSLEQQVSNYIFGSGGASSGCNE